MTPLSPPSPRVRTRAQKRLGFLVVFLFAAPLSAKDAAPGGRVALSAERKDGAAGPSRETQKPRVADQPFSVGVEVKLPGLVRQKLPYEILDRAGPGAGSLRLFDAEGNEIPFFLDRPRERPGEIVLAEKFESRLEASETVLSVVTGTADPLDAVLIETPDEDFTKPVSVDGALPGQRWLPLARGIPLFRRRGGAAENTTAEFPRVAVARLRVVVPHAPGEPLALTGVRLRKAPRELTETDALRAALSPDHKRPEGTQWTARLPFRNLPIVSVSIETDEPLFTRRVVVGVPRASDGEIRYEPVGAETVYRVAVEGGPARSRLAIPARADLPVDELRLFVEDGDNPPLRLRGLSARVVPTALVFHSPGGGGYRLAFGAPNVKPPSYDLARIQGLLAGRRTVSARLGPLHENAAFVPADPLPELPELGAPLKPAAWKYAVDVAVPRGGVQRLEAGLPVLSAAQPDGRDLRLLKGDRQVPFFLQRNGPSRPLAVSPEAPSLDAEKKVSRWTLPLPQKNLPLLRLTCRAAEGIFDRSVILFEDRFDDRGEKYRVTLAYGRWTRTPGAPTETLPLFLFEKPQTARVTLEVKDGDNAPLHLDGFAFSYQPLFLIFKASAGSTLRLLYGNPKAAPPSYDIAVASDDLLAAEKNEIALSGGAPSSTAKFSPERLGAPAGWGRVLFWVCLALAAAALLALLKKLLPPPPRSSGDGRRAGGSTTPPPSGGGKSSP